MSRAVPPPTSRVLEFATSILPAVDSVQIAVNLARQAEQLGFDLIGIQDHPYQPAFLETWTFLVCLASQTERIRFFPNVANLPTRSPALLAKSAATLDRLTGGRIELGLGAGGAAYWPGVQSMGFTRRSPQEALEHLAEAVEVIRLVWAEGQRVSFRGKHLRLDNFAAGPAPAHPMGIWLGAIGPRALKLTGRVADGWSVSRLMPDQLKMKQKIIDESALAAGREPAAIRRQYNATGRITAGAVRGWLDGPVDYWIDTLAELVLDVGFDSFLLWFTSGSTAQETFQSRREQRDETRQLEIFASEVMPAVREAVSCARTRSS